MLNIYNFGEIPLVNAFNIEKSVASVRYPLSLNVCTECWVCQLDNVPEQDAIFKNYMHFSGASIDNTKHLKQTAFEIDKYLHRNSRVLEVGCNDGTFLSCLNSLGHITVGVDPALNMAEIVRNKNCNIISGYFGPKLVPEILNKNNNFKFDCILGFNVFAHYKEVQQSFDAMSLILDDNGLFVFEVAYAVDTIFKGNYDTVYHEHVFNHSLLGLKNMLSKAELKIIAVNKLTTQGGSIRVFTTKSSCKLNYKINNDQYDSLVNTEISIGLNTVNFYSNINKIIVQSINNIKSRLNEFINNKNEKVFILGAPARGVVVANTCRFDLMTNLLIIDDTIEKHGKYFPGLGFKVHNWNIVKDNLDCNKCILLSWNYKETMVNKLKEYRFSGEVHTFMPHFSKILI
jgi:hypothetical protein